MTTKWISIAKQWLCENTPCDKLTALEQIAAKMPLTVRMNGAIANRSAIAKDAIVRCYKKKFCDLPSKLEKLDAKRSSFLGYSATIRSLAARPEGVTKLELRDIKHGATLARQLWKKGQLSFDGKVYRLI